jgi:predicted nuclease with TOPRIM domain
LNGDQILSFLFAPEKCMKMTQKNEVIIMDKECEAELNNIKKEIEKLNGEIANLKEEIEKKQDIEDFGDALGGE